MTGARRVTERSNVAVLKNVARHIASDADLRTIFLQILVLFDFCKAPRSVVRDVLEAA
jgi:hypothetical protein